MCGMSISGGNDTKFEYLALLPRGRSKDTDEYSLSSDNFECHAPVTMSQITKTPSEVCVEYKSKVKKVNSVYLKI